MGRRGLSLAGDLLLVFLDGGDEFLADGHAVLEVEIVEDGAEGQRLSFLEQGEALEVLAGILVFAQQGQRFERVPGIDLACWNLTLSTEGLMAATTSGVWLITPDGSARHLSMTNTMSLMDDGKQFFCGESDGVWLIDKQTRRRRLVCRLDNVTEIVRDGEGILVRGGTQIQAGDNVVVFCHNADMKRIEKFFL